MQTETQQPARLRKTPEELAPWGALVAGALVMWGSFLPFVTVTSAFGRANFTDIDGDGRIYFVLGGAVLAIAGAYITGNLVLNRAMWGVKVGSFLAGAGAIYKIADAQHLLAYLNERSGVGTASIGVVLYLILLAALLGLVAAMFMRGPQRLGWRRWV